MSGTPTIITITILGECDIHDDIIEILAPDETAIGAYRTSGDSAVFTNKRIITRDQNIISRKAEIYSLPYTSIQMWSMENTGIRDVGAEVEFWTKAGQVKVNLRKGVDVNKFGRLVAGLLLK